MIQNGKAQLQADSNVIGMCSPVIYKHNTARVARRLILVRNNRKAVRLLRIESGAAPVFPASLPPRGCGQYAS